MKRRNGAAYYVSGAAGALLLAGTMGAAALALLPYLPGGAALAGAWGGLCTAGGAAAVWCAAAGSVGACMLHVRLRPEDPEEPEPPETARKRPAHEKAPKHEKTKVTV